MNDKGLSRPSRPGLPIAFPIFVLVFFTAGCISGSKNPSQIRDTIDARAFQVQTKNSRPEFTQAILGSPKSAIYQAVLANDRYQSAANFELATLSEIDAAQSALRPQLSLVSRVGLTKKISGLDAGKVDNGAAAGLKATQLVYDGGASDAATNQAIAASIEAQSRRLAVANQVAFDALSAWIGRWQASQRLALANQQSHELSEILAQIERMYANGMIDRATIEVAKRKIGQAEMQLIELRAGNEVATANLGQYFGGQLPPNILPSEILNRDTILRSIADQEGSPAIREAAAQLVTSEFSVKSAQAAMKPTVSLEGGLNSPTTANGSGDASVGIVFEYSFGAGGRLEAELKSAQARQLALESDLSNKKEALKLQLDTDRRKFEALVQTLAQLESQVALLDRELDTITTQLGTGQSSLGQVMETKLALFQSKDAIIVTESERMGLLASIAGKTGYLASAVGIE